MSQTKVQVYGSIVVSILICAAFILGIYEANMRGDQHTVDLLNGALVGAFITVVGFWLGSSAGSQKKDAMLAAAAPPVLMGNDNEKLPPPKAI